MVQLREDHSAVLVHGRGQPPVGLERVRQVLPRDAREAGRRGRVHDAVTGDQEAGAAAGTGGLVVDVALGVDAGLREELHVGGLHDAVADGDVADSQWAEEVRVGAHHATVRRMSDFCNPNGVRRRNSP